MIHDSGLLFWATCIYTMAAVKTRNATGNTILETKSSLLRPLARFPLSDKFPWRRRAIRTQRISAIGLYTRYKIAQQNVNHFSLNSIEYSSIRQDLKKNNLSMKEAQ